MEVCLLHHCALSELKNKFSDEEYLIWAAYVELRTRRQLESLSKIPDELPQSHNQFDEPYSLDDDHLANRVEQILRL